jgi:hypothetical protein
MSDEVENKGGFFSNLKNQIITGATAILATMGTVFIDEIKSLIGIGEDETEQVQGVQQNNEQSQSNNQNQSVIINIPEQKVSPNQTIVRETVKEVPAKPVEKKKEKEDVDW